MLSRYYIADKNTVITLSKGLPDFYFGTEDHLVQYYKRDISKIEIKRRTSLRSPIRDFAVYKICMADGTALPFTSILISPDQLFEKIPGVPISEVLRFAWPAFKAS
ncbi:hypothetical protein [Niabella hirudinis]|uniref:hypothetical protein n=1 Tax=Niabella hirudinis TaxID=1285929 RepID=UPI003EBF7C79